MNDKGNNNIPIHITVGGKTFKSILEACKYYNLNYNTVCVRINKRNWSIEEAFELVERNNSCKPIIVGGKTFNSITEACRYYNLYCSKVLCRINKLGWSIEEAFELVPREKNINSITLEGKTFKNKKEACRYYNLNYSKVNKRLDIGWSIEEAFELVPRKNLNEITLEGKTFKNKKEACKYYNLNYNTVCARINKCNWSIEEAFELVERNNSCKPNNCKPVTVDNKTFRSIKEACKYYNLYYDKVKYRLNNNWTLEEAFGLVERNNSCKPIIVGGKTFISIAEACRYYNLDYNKVYGRINDNWTNEEAFELVPRKRNN